MALGGNKVKGGKLAEMGDFSAWKCVAHGEVWFEVREKRTVVAVRTSSSAALDEMMALAKPKPPAAPVVPPAAP